MKNQVFKYTLPIFLIFCSSLAFGQGLELGEEEAKAVVDAASVYPYKHYAWFYLLYAGLFFGFVIFAALKSKTGWVPPVSLGELPVPARALITLMLSAYGLVHLFALLEVYLQAKVENTSAGEYFFYMTLRKLVATSHAHFFGHGTMYTLTSVAFLFSSAPERIKTLLICIAMGSGLLDVPGWWATKYAGDKWELVSVIAGAMSALGFGAMAFWILCELWIRRKKL